jgi:hypothetical protein
MSIGRLFHNASEMGRLGVSRLKGGAQLVSLIVVLRYCIGAETLLVGPDARCFDGDHARRRWKGESARCGEDLN